MNSRNRSLCGAVLAAAVCTTSVWALQLTGVKKVPGEKWSQKITVEMAGMSMPMGGSEVCAPVGSGAELLAKPQPNCTVTNVVHSGNRMTANVTCTGKDAMTGTVDLVSDASSVRGTMTMKTSDGDQMTMRMVSTKLPGACEANDYSEAKVAAPKNMPAAPAQVDVCTAMAASIKKDGKIGSLVEMFGTPGGQCATAPKNKPFCDALQTPTGFLSVAEVERTEADMAKAMAQAKTPYSSPAWKKQMLSTATSSCGLGAGPAAVTALRTRLTIAAEAEANTAFLVSEAPAKAAELFKRECVVRGEMYAGRTKKWDTFCDAYENRPR